MNSTTSNTLRWALQVNMNLSKHNKQQSTYQKLYQRSKTFYHFSLFKSNVIQATYHRKKIIKLWQNQYLRIGFAAFQKHTNVAHILLRSFAYLQWQAWTTWKDYVLYDRQEEIAAYLISDTHGSIRDLKSAWRRWRRGIQFFQRERDLTRVAIAKYRRKCRLTAQLFQRWLHFIVKRRRARTRLTSVANLWINKKYRERFNRWNDVSRRIGVSRRRKLRDAMALWSQATVLKCLRAWSFYCRKLRSDRKKALGKW